MGMNKYKVRCEVDEVWKVVTSDVEPTLCPDSHAITASKTFICPDSRNKDRFHTYNPPNSSPYTTGVQATLTLTSDGDGYKFGLEDEQNDAVMHNICLYDTTSCLMYDGCDVEVTLHYYLETGHTTTAKKVRIDFVNDFIADGDDFEDGSSTSLVKDIDVDGLTVHEAQTVVMGVTSGSAGAHTFKVKWIRPGTHANDTFTGEFYIIGFRFRRV